VSESFDAMRKRQQRDADEKLAALLATVTTRPKGRDRLPRKVGVITAETGIEDGYRKERATFTLRLDTGKGEFIAEHGDILYVAKTREALQAKMNEVARATVDLRWTRYLEISYRAESDRRSNSWMDLDLGQRRKRSHRIYGLHLFWEVVEYSDEFSIPGSESKRMRREVDEDGEFVNSSTVKELPDGLVPFTTEREALLGSIVEALTALDARMVGLLRGSPNAVAARLDALTSGQKLLAGATETPPDDDDDDQEDEEGES
jgi:hypothetical protein